MAFAKRSRFVGFGSGFGRNGKSLCRGRMEGEFAGFFKGVKEKEVKRMEENVGRRKRKKQQMN